MTSCTGLSVTSSTCSSLKCWTFICFFSWVRDILNLVVVGGAYACTGPGECVPDCKQFNEGSDDSVLHFGSEYLQCSTDVLWLSFGRILDHDRYFWWCYRQVLNRSSIFVIIFVNSRFLEHTQKRSCEALNQNKIDRQWSKPRESSRPSVRRLWWMVFGVEIGREVWGREWIFIHTFI